MLEHRKSESCVPGEPADGVGQYIKEAAALLANAERCADDLAEYVTGDGGTAEPEPQEPRNMLEGALQLRQAALRLDEKLAELFAALR